MIDLGRPSATMRYFGEMFIAPLIAVVLFTKSSLGWTESIVAASAGVGTWTLAEYTFHRFVLHHYARTRHGRHHADPGEPILSIFWQIWVCFAIIYLITGGAFLAGSLTAYAWYLLIHHSAHHSPDRLPAFLIRNHQGHHRLASRNFGVTTAFWDHIFGTVLR